MTTTPSQPHAAPEPANPNLKRAIPANLVEATPSALGQWLLALPFLIFASWFFMDLVRSFLPIPWPWLDWLIGLTLFLGLIVFPFGLLAHWLVMSFPRLFQHAGWDLEPLEPVKAAEMYLVRYQFRARHWAAPTGSRLWLRAAQGWVYWEILAILSSVVIMPLLFFSALEFGFGS